MTTEFRIRVSDRRGKFEPRTYTVTAEAEFLAYGEATRRYITDNNYRDRNPTERLSSYVARFWNEVV